MSTWVFDFALTNDFPNPNWGHFPLVWVFQLEIWESNVFFCKESQTMSTWVFDFALINDFPPPKLGSFPSALGLPGGNMGIQCIFGGRNPKL